MHLNEPDTKHGGKLMAACDGRKVQPDEAAKPSNGPPQDRARNPYVKVTARGQNVAAGRLGAARRRRHFSFRYGPLRWADSQLKELRHAQA